MRAAPMRASLMLAGSVLLLLDIRAGVASGAESPASTPRAFKLVVRVVSEYWRPTSARVEYPLIGASDVKHVALTDAQGGGYASVDLPEMEAQYSEYRVDPVGYLKKKKMEYEVWALSDAFDDKPHTRIRLVPIPGESWVQLRFEKPHVSHGLFLGPTR